MKSQFPASLASLAGLLKGLVAILGLVTLYLIGTIQHIPSELRGLIDFQFVFSQTSSLSFAAILAGLATSFSSNFIGPMFGPILDVGKRSSRTGWRHRTVLFGRILRIYVRRHPLIAQLLIFVLLFSLFYLGIPFFYRIIFVAMLSGMIFISIVSIGARDLKEWQTRPVAPETLISASALATGVFAFALGAMSGTNQLFNYADIILEDSRKTGALIGTTSQGVFLIEGYDWKVSMARDQYSTIFVPYASIDLIRVRPRTIEAFAFN